MISEIAIDVIKKNVFLDFQGIEDTENVQFLEVFETDPKYLLTYHEILQSEVPSIELHYFVFSKMTKMIENISENWECSVFSQILDWALNYISYRSYFLRKSDHRLLSQFIQFFVSFANFSSKLFLKFDFLIENIISHLFLILNSEETQFLIQNEVNRVSNEDIEDNLSNILTVSILILEKIVQNCNKFEQKKGNIFDFIIKILALLNEKRLIINLNLNGSNIEDSGNNNLFNFNFLKEYVFTVIWDLADFLVPSHFFLFFDISEKFPGFENPLKVCELCLTKHISQISSNSTNDNEAVSDFMQIDLIEFLERKIDFFLIQDFADVNFLNYFYFTNFIDIIKSYSINLMEKRKESFLFPTEFIEKFEVFTIKSLNSSVILLHPDSALRLMDFWRYFGNKTKKGLRNYFLQKIFDSLETDINSFSKILMLDECNESCSFISILPGLFREKDKHMNSTRNSIISDLLYFVSKNIFSNINKFPEITERNILVSSQLALLIRIASQIFKYQLLRQNNERKNILTIIFTIQKKLLKYNKNEYAVEEENCFNNTFQFTDISKNESDCLYLSEREEIAFLLFNKFFVEIDENLLIEKFGNDEYEIIIDVILNKSHFCLQHFQNNANIVNLSISIISSIMNKEKEGIFVDYDFIIENPIEFDYNINFENSVHFSEIFGSLIPFEKFDVLFHHILEIKENNVFSHFQRYNMVKKSIFSHFCGVLNAEISNKINNLNSLQKKKKYIYRCINYLYPNYFILLSENIINIQIDELQQNTLFIQEQISIQKCFLYFVNVMIKAMNNSNYFSSANSFNHQNEGNLFFIKISSVVKEILLYYFLNDKINNFAFEGKDLLTFVEICFSISSVLLKSEFVCFDAFILYKEPIFYDLINTLIKTTESIGLNFIVENEKLRIQLYKLMKSLCLKHIYFISNSFENFYLSIISEIFPALMKTLSYQKFIKLLYIFIHSFIKIEIEGNGNVGLDNSYIHSTDEIMSYILIKVDLEDFMKDVFIYIMNSFRENHNNCVQIFAKTFGEYIYINDQILFFLQESIESKCNVVNRHYFNQLIVAIHDAVSKKEMEAIKMLFVKIILNCMKFKIDL